VSLQERMREMFSRMVEAKDASLVDTYYDPDFRMITNGQEQDLAEFRAGHARVYPTSITYRVEYDDDGWVESGTGWPRGSGSPSSDRGSGQPGSRSCWSLSTATANCCG